MWPANVTGKPGIVKSQMCVDCTFVPSGRLTVMGFVAIGCANDVEHNVRQRLLKTFYGLHKSNREKGMLRCSLQPLKPGGESVHFHFCQSK